MGLLPDMYNCRMRMPREYRERFPRHLFERKTLGSDPDMNHGTCVTHVPWCMSGSLNRGGGENVMTQLNDAGPIVFISTGCLHDQKFRIWEKMGIVFRQFQCNIHAVIFYGTFAVWVTRHIFVSIHHLKFLTDRVNIYNYQIRLWLKIDEPVCKHVRFHTQ